MSEVNHNFIAGEWLAGTSEIANINPSDLSDTIGLYAQADNTQLQRALEAAADAQKQWAKTGLEKRYNLLMNIGNELIANCEELGTLLAREEGKTQPEGKGDTRPKCYARSVTMQNRFATVSKSTFAASRSARSRLFRRGIFRWRRLFGKLPRRWPLAMR